jgi:diguanylate cyclase (GGDEF)-like protein
MDLMLMSLEFPSGPVPLDSQFYIPRPPIEELAYQEITKPGSVTRIKAPRHTGKSSLILRIINRARQLEYKTVTLDLQQVDEEFFQELNKFLRWFCANISRQLGLKPILDDYWDRDIGSKISCTLYLQGYILAEIDSPLVLILNEVNRVFEYPKLAREFLPLLRSWHEEAKQEESLQKLRLVVAHSTEIYLSLNINQSPFNVGLPLKLTSFTLEQVRDLASRYGLGWESSLPVEKLMAMVGGHPYLIQLAFYHLSQENLTLDRLLEEAPTEAGIYRDTLRGYLEALEKQPELMAALQQVIASPTPVQLKPIVAYKLDSMGLLKMDGSNCTISCQLYRDYLSRNNLALKELTDLKIEQLEQENQRLETLCAIDELTQLANRRSFDKYFDFMWQKSTEEGFPLSIILCDVDFFKNYNDTCGHLAGDECLRAIATALRQVIKRETDLLARYGGEEFAVVLPDTEAFTATFFAEQMREAVKALNIPHLGLPGEMVVSISLGLACTVASWEEESSVLLKAADEALYESKRSGRDRLSISQTLDYGLLD